MSNINLTPDTPSQDVSHDFAIDLTQLAGRDLVARVFFRVFSDKLGWVIVATMLFYNFVYVGMGIILSLGYEARGMLFQSALDIREFPAVVNTAVSAAVVNIFYIWQMLGIRHMFRSMRENRIIGLPDEEGLTVSALLDQRLFQPLRSVIFPLISLLVPVIGMVIYLPGIGSDPATVVDGPRWWQVSPIYMAVWVIFVSVAMYMLVMMLFRQIFAVRTLTALFKKFEVRPKLFHHDRSSGTGAIGHYALRIGLLALYFGYWVSLLFYLLPLFIGNQPEQTLVAILVQIAYLILLPFFLIPPVWQAHIALRDAKRRQLEEIAAQIRAALMEPVNISDSEGLPDPIEILEKRYRLIDQELHTWPFPLPALQRFGVGAILPIISTGAPILIERWIDRNL